jgi:hypothetical protein
MAEIATAFSSLTAIPAPFARRHIVGDALELPKPMRFKMVKRGCIFRTDFPTRHAMTDACQFISQRTRFGSEQASKSDAFALDPFEPCPLHCCQDCGYLRCGQRSMGNPRFTSITVKGLK